MSLVLLGSTSGSVTLQEPAIAGSTVIDLPATSGTMAVTGGSPSFTNVTATGDLTVNGNTTLGDASTDTILMTGAPSIGGAGLGMGMGFRNRIINGAMVIDQRNAGASVSTSGSFVTDRFKFNYAGGGTISAQQATDSLPTGYSYALKLTVGTADTSIAAGDEYIFDTTVEGFNFADFLYGSASAQTCTISFWVRSSVTGTYSATLKNSANSRAYPATYTINVANTWEQKTITVAGDTTGTWIGATNGIGLRLRFCLVSGSTYLGTPNAWQAGDLDGATGQANWMATSGNTFYITGIQLEKGSTATSFDYRPYGTELMLCQRYYYRQTPTGTTYYGVGFNDSTTVASLFINFPVPLRAAPSSVEQSGTASNYRVQYTGNVANCSAVPQFNFGDVWGAMVLFTVASGLTAGQASMGRSNGASGYLGFSAEL
jgi:hypothetical protein